VERLEATEQGHGTNVKCCRVMLEMRRRDEFPEFIEDLIGGGGNGSIRVVHVNEQQSARKSGLIRR
jgi:hypothetical protein